MSGESEVENCNGFRFCKECGKLCIPLRADVNEPNIMIFRCGECGEKRCVINLKVRNDQVIKKTQILQSEAADIKNKALGEDPSMPRRVMYCRYCQVEQEVVYYYKAGKEEKNIVIQYICRESGYSWTSDEYAQWKKLNQERAELPEDFKLEDDDIYIPQEEDQEDEFYQGEGSDMVGDKQENDADDIFGDGDDIFGEDEQINDEE